MKLTGLISTIIITYCLLIPLKSSAFFSNCRATDHCQGMGGNPEEICSGITNQAVCQANQCCGWISPSESPSDESVETAGPSLIIPELKINLPGLLFSDQNKIQSSTDGEKTFFYVPWIGEYINWLYNYSIGIIALLAIIAIMIGGFYWLLAGGNASRVSEAKSWINAALSGLILALSSYVLLFTINSNLVSLPSIKVTYLTRQDIDIINPEMYRLITGNSNSTVSIDRDTINSIKRFSQEENIEPCLIYAVVANESGGQLSAIGHDEMVPTSRTAYNSFRISGATYKNIKPIPTRKGKLVNDDYDCINKTNNCNPKTLSLDWRFSHGIGLFQATIFPYKCTTLSTYDTTRDSMSRERCNLATKCDGIRNGTGSDYGFLFSDGSCINLRDLITMDGALRWLSKTWKSYYCTQGMQPYECFRRFAGTGSWADTTAQKKMITYEYCMNNKTTIFKDSGGGAGGGF